MIREMIEDITVNIISMTPGMERMSMRMGAAMFRALAHEIKSISPAFAIEPAPVTGGCASFTLYANSGIAVRVFESGSGYGFTVEPLDGKGWPLT